MRQRSAFAVAIAVAVLWSGGSVVVADCPPKAEVTAVVAGAIDGATLRMADGTVVRLAGIEAPLRSLTADVDSPWPSGETARVGLDRLAAGTTIRLAPVGDAADRYGRRHAYVFLGDGRSLQAALIADGLVRARWYPGEDGCFLSFLAAEKAPRDARRGLWGDPEYAVRRADDPSLLARNGLYDLIEGRVVSIGHGSRMIFLDFGRNFRNDFTVMVPPSVAGALDEAGHGADGFAGRRVRVRGVIEESGGPAIRLNDPAEIEFVDDGQDDVGAPR